VDIKLPLGLIFSIIGLLLMISGIVYSEAVVQKLHFNFNLWWGIGVTVFGLAMLSVHWIRKDKTR